MQEVYMSKLWLWQNYLAYKRPINKPMSAKSPVNIRSHHVYTIFVHAANYLCYSWVYVVFGAKGEVTSLSLFLSSL